MSKYKKGDKVYRARVGTGFDDKPRLAVAEVTVEACGQQVVALNRDEVIEDAGWALGFSTRPTLSSVYPTRLDALEALAVEAVREVAEAEKRLAQREAELKAVRDELYRERARTVNP